MNSAVQMRPDLGMMPVAQVWPAFARGRPARTLWAQNSAGLTPILQKGSSVFQLAVFTRKSPGVRNGRQKPLFNVQADNQIERGCWRSCVTCCSRTACPQPGFPPPGLSTLLPLLPRGFSTAGFHRPYRRNRAEMLLSRSNIFSTRARPASAMRFAAHGLQPCGVTVLARARGLRWGVSRPVSPLMITPEIPHTSGNNGQCVRESASMMTVGNRRRGRGRLNARRWHDQHVVVEHVAADLIAE